MNIKKRFGFVVVLLFLYFILHGNQVHADLITFPDSINVTITNFSQDRKDNCSLIEEDAANAGYARLGEYIKSFTLEVDSVPLRLYSKRVLPHEWVPSWEEESLRAGAVAVKNFAWYTKDADKWDGFSFDITDTTCDQIYNETQEDLTKTDQAVDFTFYYYAQKTSGGSDQLLETRHTRGTENDGTKNGLDAGKEMSQHGTQYWARDNKVWEWIIDYYYDDSFLARNIEVGDVVEAKIGKFQTWKFYLPIPENHKGFEVTLISTNPLVKELELTILNPSGGVEASNTTLSFNKKLTITNPQSDTVAWTVEVFNNEASYDFTGLALFIKAIAIQTPADESGPGGINFTSANLNFISTCDPSELSFVMKAEEANVSAGDEIINITNATIQSMDAFLTGLVIPDHMQWITMDINGPINPDYRGAYDGKCGDVSRVDSTFAQTEVARVLWDADNKMKEYEFGPYADQWGKNMMQDWIDNVSSSPYYSEMQAKGFNSFPNGKKRSFIHPAKTEAKGDGCTVYLTNLTLNVTYVWDNWYLDLSPYGFRQEIIDDLNQRLDDWIVRNTQTHQQQVSNTTIYQVNNDPEFADLRRVFAALTLAQWYKKQDRHKIPLGDIIDSNNITGLNISFDIDYWNTEACHYIYTQTQIPTFNPGQYWTWNWYGGVMLASSAPNTTESMDNNTAELMQNATQQEYVQQNETYFFATTKKPQKPDLSAMVVGFNSLTPEANKIINVSIVVLNKGKVASGNFTVYFYYEYIYPNGYTAKYDIGTEEFSSLDADGVGLYSISWNDSKLGSHTVFAVVDYNNDVEEINELNNIKNTTIDIGSPYPSAVITSPSSDYQTLIYNSTTLTGYATDEQDGYLNDSALNWTSSIDGYLGNGSSLNVNLSVGNHIITFTAIDSDDNIGTDTVAIGVTASLPPIVSINSPLDGQHIAEGATVYFDGEANDPEQGALTGSSLNWSSSIDGFLSNSLSFNTNSLSAGTHSITFIATDLSNTKTEKQITITIDEGTPILSIATPTDAQEFYYNANIDFSAAASDPQDGNLSDSIQWVSSMDDILGVGAFFNKSLSIGTHTITASVIDTHGLTDIEEITITVLPPQQPTTSIIKPQNNKTFTRPVNITFKGSSIDPEDGALSGASLNWSSNINGSLGNGTEFSLNSSNLGVGTHVITLIGTDADSMSTTTKLNITVNSAIPITSIISPSDNDTIFTEGQTITFNGTATDLEDGALSGSSLNWTSSKDGFLGTGLLELNNLTSGTHLITFTAKDSHNVSSSESVTIFVIGENSIQISTLSDGSANKNLTFTKAENKTVYVKLPVNATITYASLWLRGFSS